jgi:Peptidase family M48
MGMGKRCIFVWALGLTFAGAALAQGQPQQTAAQSTTQAAAQTNDQAAAAAGQPTTFAQVVDRVIAREHEEVAVLRHYSPIIETYIQDMKMDPKLGLVPDKDHYFLGQADLAQGIIDDSMLPGNRKSWKQKMNPVADLSSAFSDTYEPSGFLQMIFVDPVYFDLQHYRFTYVRREFLGAVRCLVIDVTPLPKSGDGRFLGRIWVEDQDYTIVRFNGVFVPVTRAFGYNLHFDTWRTNAAPGIWVPTYIYSAESDLKEFPFGKVRFRSQTRLWGYDLKAAAHESEFSDLTVEASKPVQDQADATRDVSPVMAQREWEREGEDNAVDRLQRNGLLAPPGPVDKVMCTVVNNLEVPNNLDIEPDVRCRVLLTSTIEAFTIGHTIVLSRGLLDVLPDEASLAAVIAHQLAFIVVGQELPDAYSFNDTTMVSTIDTMRRMSFRSSEIDEEASAKKAIEYLEKSIYKDQLGKAGLFLKQVAADQKDLSSLISANVGNHVYMADALIQAAPPLDPARLDQITALPLGARIIMDPWDDEVELAKSKPVQLLSAREKMPFQVTPFMPYLTRYTPPQSSATGDPARTDAAKKNP